MPFQPAADQRLTIEGRTYRLVAHPAAPGLPYGQEGRQAVVYALIEAGDAAADPAGEPPRSGPEGLQATLSGRRRW